MEDVNLKTGQIKILEAKKQKDRMVVMSDDMLELARRYNEQVSCKYPDRSFFHNHLTRDVFECSYAKNFRVLLDMEELRRQMPPDL